MASRTRRNRNRCGPWSSPPSPRSSPPPPACAWTSTALARPAVLGAAVAVLAVAVVGKFGGVFVGARLNRGEALALGAGMDSRGVVEVIVAMAGLRLGVLNTETYTIVVLVAIVTSLMAPPILRYAMAHAEETAGTRLGMDTQTAAPEGTPDHGPDVVRPLDHRGDA